MGSVVTRAFIWPRISRSCGGWSADRVLEIASGALRPAGRSAPGGRAGRTPEPPACAPMPEVEAAEVAVVLGALMGVEVIGPATPPTLLIMSSIPIPSVALPSCEKSTRSFRPMIS